MIVKIFSVLAVDDDPIQLTMLAEIAQMKKDKCCYRSRPDNVLNILKKQDFRFNFLDISNAKDKWFHTCKKHVRL